MARFALVWLLVTVLVSVVGPLVILGVHELSERLRTWRFERRIGWRKGTD